MREIFCKEEGQKILAENGYIIKESVLYLIRDGFCKGGIRARLCIQAILDNRLCKVVELSMQCCGKLLSDSFETYLIRIQSQFLLNYEITTKKNKVKIIKYSNQMVRNIFLKRNLSINQCQNQLFRFHHLIEFLIFFEFIRRFLKILQMSSFRYNNYKKSAENL